MLIKVIKYLEEIKDQSSINSVGLILNDVNHELDNYKKISKVILVKDDWTPENEMTTPTLKIKRAKIDEKFSIFYKDWEKRDNDVIWE